MKEDKNFKGHMVMIVANVIFGLNAPIAKAVLSTGSISPYALNLFRMCGAAALFWIASLFVPRERVSRRDLVLLFFASLFSIQLNQTSFLIGLSMTSPIDASIIATLVPILTMLIAAFTLREPITWTKAIGVAVGASGALMLVLGNSTISRGAGSVAGDMLCILGACSFAIYLGVFKSLIQRYSSITLMKWMFLYAGVFSTTFCLKDALSVDYAALPAEIWSGILYVVVGSTFIAYLLIPIGQKRLRPTVVSMYNYLQPFIASLLAVVMGLDRFGLIKGIAAFLVFAGVYAVTQSKSRAQLEATTTPTTEK